MAGTFVRKHRKGRADSGDYLCRLALCWGATAFTGLQLSDETCQRVQSEISHDRVAMLGWRSSGVMVSQTLMVLRPGLEGSPCVRGCRAWRCMAIHTLELGMGLSAMMLRRWCHHPISGTQDLELISRRKMLMKKKGPRQVWRWQEIMPHSQYRASQSRRHPPEKVHDGGRAAS